MPLSTQWSEEVKMDVVIKIMSKLVTVRSLEHLGFHSVHVEVAPINAVGPVSTNLSLLPPLVLIIFSAHSELLAVLNNTSIR